MMYISVVAMAIEMTVVLYGESTHFALNQNWQIEHMFRSAFTYREFIEGDSLSFRLV